MVEEGIPMSQLSQQSSTSPFFSDTTSSTGRNKLKSVLAILLVVGVVATVGACAAGIGVFSTSGGHGGEGEEHPNQQRQLQSIDLEAQHQKMMEHVQRSVRRAGSTRGRGGQNHRDDCVSSMNNHTIPAAHIDGSGYRWEATTPLFSSKIPSYTTSWTCQGQNNAYVAGGMVFNQTEKALHVPTCGYYYISSQVNFHFDPEDQPGLPPLDYKAMHQLYVDRNCTGQDSREFKILAYSPLGDGSYTSEGATYVSDMVKICTGGKIWITIPDTIPCCPRGNPPLGTFLSAYLVHQTDCEWPPNQ